MKKQLPVKRSPVTTLALRAHIGRRTLVILDFHRCDKFRFAFFAFVKVHHSKKKERVRLKKPFLCTTDHRMKQKQTLFQTFFK